MRRISTSVFTLDQRPAPDASGRVVLSLHGELDLAVAVEVRALIQTEISYGSEVVIDLSGLEFVDSTGLTALLKACEYAAGAGTRITLAGPLRRQVRRVLRLTGADELLALDAGEARATREAHDTEPA